jgi:hypothetical protein
MDDMGEMMGAALAAMFHALVLLLMFAVMLAARALQAVFTLARPALLFGSACATGFGAVKLFPIVAERYGGDLFAIVLALAMTSTIPASLIMLALETVGLWPVLWASAGLMIAAAFAISRAPPVVLALLPVLALAACIFHFAFGQDFHLDLEEGQENEHEQERERFGAVVAHHDSPNRFYGESECAPGTEHPTG